MTDYAGFYPSDYHPPKAPSDYAGPSRPRRADTPTPATPWDVVTAYLETGPMRDAHKADARVTASEIINRLYRSGYSIIRNEVPLP